MKRMDVFNYVAILLGVLLAAVVALSVLSGFNIILTLVSVVILIVLSLFGYSIYKKRYSENVKIMDRIAKSLDYSGKYAMAKFPLPVVISNLQGNFVWYNNVFLRDVLLGTEPIDKSISQFFGGKNASETANCEKFEVDYRGNSFTVICEGVDSPKNDLFIYYFIDNTELKRASGELELSKPVVMIISVDGIDESSNMRDSEKAGYLGDIENVLEKWVSENDGFMRKTDAMKFICIMDERNFRNIVDKKFEILDRVRVLSYNGSTGATLSIGIGRGKSLQECDEAARQAFDMALGRGGDQAAVKNGETFEFYGGVSKGVEKRTKVRIRVVASNLKELVQKSTNVLVMGHRFSDFDSLGACIALCSWARAIGKTANIAVSKSETLASSLSAMLDENGLSDMIVEPKNALQLVTDNTLLIIADTHNKELLESREIYDKCKKMVVIDHHRKIVGHIDDAIIFYHEPFSSSTCEMVTELLQYVGSKQPIGSLQANALLAGIMLDTKNFALRTGVRTFEAAGYLRSNGADTVAVRRLFSNSKEIYRDKNRIVSDAKIYGVCAISTVDFETENIRLASAQAADEMLNINGVKASFVLYRTETTVNISARSLGDLNVQLIMEKLGGGGHQTMAAVQIKSDSFEEAKEMLLGAIKNYVADLN